jgi:Fic family protein
LVLKAAIAHLWFVTIHPFEDGNGRISRALSDMLLARSDEQSYRFYSMSTQIRKERCSYYDILEKTQRSGLDITNWLEWFLKCLMHAIENSEKLLEKIIYKHSFWIKHSRVNINDRQIKILNMLMEDIEGVLNTTKWAKIGNCSQDTALRDIQDLIEKGILVKCLQRGRSTNYELKSND